MQDAAISVEELEALQQKVMEYEQILGKNQQAEQELKNLQEQRMALEQQQPQLEGESRGK